MSFRRLSNSNASNDHTEKDSHPGDPSYWNYDTENTHKLLTKVNSGSLASNDIRQWHRSNLFHAFCRVVMMTEEYSWPDLNLSHQQWQCLLESLTDVNCVQHLNLLSIRCLHKRCTDVRQMLHGNTVQHLLSQQHMFNSSLSQQHYHDTQLLTIVTIPAFVKHRIIRCIVTVCLFLHLRNTLTYLLTYTSHQWHQLKLFHVPEKSKTKVATYKSTWHDIKRQVL